MKRIKKIYFYINTLSRGGAERVCIQLAKFYYSNGVDARIITSYEDEFEYDLPDYIKRINLHTTRFNYNIFTRNFILIKRLRKVLKTDKPDILVSFMAEGNLRSVIASVGLNNKTIISVRNDPNFEYAGIAGGIVGNFILPCSDGCVFQTEDARNWFPNRLKIKSTVILNPVRKDIFEITRQPDKWIAVSVGRLDEQKNHELLIESFESVVEKYDNAKLHIFGEGDLKYKLQNLIDKKNLNQNIKLCGFEKNINLVLSKADIFILSSNYEGMPNALMEALAAGVPSISTDCPCGGPKTLIKDGYNGILVPVGDKGRLSLEIINLIADEEKKNKLSDNAKVESKKYDTDIINKQWEQFINKIANNNKS